MTIKKITIKDPGSAITHFIAAVLSLIVAMPLIIKTIIYSDSIHLISLVIFAFSMVLLYSASTIYHTLDISPKMNKLLKKIDHMSIFVLIAGSYTPVCLIALNGFVGYSLLIIIWSIAILGILFKGFWVTCPKWLSSSIYILMGWTCVLAFSPILRALSTAAFLWLLIGGIIYTLGGIIYALKLPIFNKKHKNFGSHEIFHLFVMAGSFCHSCLVYKFISAMPI